MFEQSSCSVKIVVITTADIFAYMKVSQALELLQKRKYMPARQTSHRNWAKLFLAVGHFTVVSLVTWPWSGSEAGVDLVLIKTLLLFICKSCSCLYLHMINRRVCIKTRSTPASLPFKGQVTKHATDFAGFTSLGP